MSYLIRFLYVVEREPHDTVLQVVSGVQTLQVHLLLKGWFRGLLKVLLGPADSAAIATVASIVSVCFPLSKKDDDFLSSPIHGESISYFQELQI